MPKADPHKDLLKLFRDYALVYSRFEKFQKHKGNGLLPGGDQKTGVIGEYYASRYISRRHKTKITYGDPGDHFDLHYKLNGKGKSVQVKTVSQHSKTRVISPIVTIGWNELFLISLNDKFEPDGFWIGKLKQKRNGVRKIQGVKMPFPNKESNSKRIYFGKNLISEFKENTQ